MMPARSAWRSSKLLRFQTYDLIRASASVWRPFRATTDLHHTLRAVIGSTQNPNPKFGGQASGPMSAKPEFDYSSSSDSSTARRRERAREEFASNFRYAYCQKDQEWNNSI